MDSIVALLVATLSLLIIFNESRYTFMCFCQILKSSIITENQYIYEIHGTKLQGSKKSNQNLLIKSIPSIIFNKKIMMLLRAGLLCDILKFFSTQEMTDFLQIIGFHSCKRWESEMQLVAWNLITMLWSIN